MPADDPIAFMLTWSTYGTWLPGDARGWIEYRHGFQLPDPILELESAARMTEDACRLDISQREQVHEQVAETCTHKRWPLHAVNCRTNHVHVVLSSPAPPKTIREQLKAWCTRRLNNHQAALLAARHVSKDEVEARRVSKGARELMLDPELCSLANASGYQKLRRLSNESPRTKWWTDRGSIRCLFTEDNLAAAIDYVLNQQDNPKRFDKPSHGKPPHGSPSR